MLWPTPLDYFQAVSGYPDVCILDGLLRSGKSKKSSTNKLILYTGGFSTVFPFEVANNIYALRCWHKDIGDSKTRYEKIDAYLKQVNLPYFVDFTYIPEGILIDGKKWPITRMKWAEGKTLRDFIDENINDPSIFLSVANEFLKLFEKLHSNRISHGDLQDGNILLKKNGQDIQISLIDYDSLFVPDLKGFKSPTRGLPEYQHPLRDNKCDKKMDYFSELVIYLSFICLSKEPNIWNTVKDKTEKGLLFSKDDFANPDQSNIFKQLGTMSSEIQQLASKLVEFLKQQSLDNLHPLEDIIPRQDANSHTNQGERFNKEKKYQDALIEFDKALVFEPNFKRAFYGRGIANLHLGKYTDSITAFNQAIGLDDNYTEAWYGLSLVYHKVGKNSDAIKTLNKVKSINPSFQPAYDLLNSIRTINTPKTSNTSKGKSKTPSQTLTSSSTKSGSSSSNPSHSKNIGGCVKFLSLEEFNFGVEKV